MFCYLGSHIVSSVFLFYFLQEKALILQEIEANKKRVKDLKDVKKLEADCQGKEKEHTTALKSQQSNKELCKIQVGLFESRFFVFF